MSRLYKAFYWQRWHQQSNPQRIFFHLHFTSRDFEVQSGFNRWKLWALSLVARIDRKQSIHLFRANRSQKKEEVDQFLFLPFLSDSDSSSLGEQWISEWEEYKMWRSGFPIQECFLMKLQRNFKKLVENSIKRKVYFGARISKIYA